MGDTIKNSFIAGILIGIGCIANLSVGIPVVGPLLFSLGLITVILQNRYLFTGKIGYFEFDKEVIIDLVVGLVFNLFGIGLFCWLFAKYGNITCDASTIVAAKLNESYLEAFLKSIGCGMLMYIAVDGYKKSQNLLAVILPVMTFILCGFDHCIANYGYMAMNGVFQCNQMPAWIIGNSVGSLIISKIK